jgi:hypothetical protein
MSQLVPLMKMVFFHLRAVESKCESQHPNCHASALINNQLLKATVPTVVVPNTCFRGVGGLAHIRKASENFNVQNIPYK